MKRRAVVLALLAGVICAISARADVLRPHLLTLAEFQSSATAAIDQQDRRSGFRISDPNLLIGTVFRCNYNNDGSYSAIGTPYSLLDQFTAKTEGLPQPLSLHTEGSLTGQLGVGPVTVSGGRNYLTRATVTEKQRLSLKTSAHPYLGDMLSLDDVRRLAVLSAAFGNNFGARSWCLVRGVSEWEVSVQTLQSQQGSVQAGFWIVTASGRYAETDNDTHSSNTILTIDVEEIPYSPQLVSAANGVWPPPSSVVPTPVHRPASPQSSHIVAADATVADFNAGAVFARTAEQTWSVRQLMGRFALSERAATAMLNRYNGNVDAAVAYDPSMLRSLQALGPSTMPASPHS